MGKLYVKALEPCDFNDEKGNVIDMSVVEFYGDPRWKSFNPETAEVEISVRKPNPNKVFEVPDTGYWTNKLINNPDRPLMPATLKLASQAEQDKFLRDKNPKKKVVVKESESEENDET